MDRSVIRTRPFLGVGYAVIGAAAARALVTRRHQGPSRGGPVRNDAAASPGDPSRFPHGHLQARGRGDGGPDPRRGRRRVSLGADRRLLQQPRLGGAYAIVPIAGEGLQWQAAVGVRKRQCSLEGGSRPGPRPAQAGDHHARGQVRLSPRTTRQRRRSARDAAATRARRGRTSDSCSFRRARRAQRRLPACRPPRLTASFVSGAACSTSIARTANRPTP